MKYAFFAVLMLISQLSFAQIDCNAVDPANLSTNQIENLKSICSTLAETTSVSSVIDANAVSAYGKVAKDFAEAIGIAAKELGVAANDFLMTPAGIVTAVVIVWKVLGENIWDIVVGIPTIMLLWTVFFATYRKAVSETVVEQMVPVKWVWGLLSYEKKVLVRTYKQISDMSEGEWFAVAVTFALSFASMMFFVFA